MSDPDLTGLTCLVTGASRGLGLVTSLRLAGMGADVVLMCRDPGRAAAAAGRIREATGSDRLETLICDFSRLSCVRDAAAAFLGSHDRLDVLVNNAGLISGERVLTEDGNELTFQVDHLAHFLLTNLLLAALKAAPAARVVTVSSAAHMSARRGIDFDDLTRERRYGSFAAYAEAKLANVMFTYELARRLAGTAVTANAAHPGGVRTGWGTGSWGLEGLGWKLIRPFLRTPEKGAETQVYLASSPEVSGVTGRYFADCREVPTSAPSYDTRASGRLWTVSADLTGVGQRAGAGHEAFSR